MTGTLCFRAVVMVAAALTLGAQPRRIDTRTSTLTVRVYKAGIFSAMGHDHTIGASIARGSVDVTARHVEFVAESSQMKVRDAGTSEKDRSQIQATMLGPELLDAGQFPDVSFQSTNIETIGTGMWKVSGNLTLHGQTRPIALNVRDADGRYSGSVPLKLTDFGMKPVKVAGGTVRVKNEIRIDFEIQLARQ